MYVLSACALLFTDNTDSGSGTKDDPLHIGGRQKHWPLCCTAAVMCACLRVDMSVS